MKLCKHGVMLYNPLDWYIGRGLEVYGEWGENKVQIWSKIVKAGHVVIEVGAHVGALVLPLSKLVGPSGRVIAYEPFYPSYATLAANVGLNSLQNVELRQAIVADKSGKVFMSRNSLAFSVHDFFNFGSMSYSSLRIYNVTEDVERPSMQWDEYSVVHLDHSSLARLDFIKLDAEAMELAILKGAARTIQNFKPIIFLEYRNPWEKDTKVVDFLRKKMRYECILLRIPIFNARNYRNHSEDIWDAGTKLVSFNLLCKHRWWEYPDIDEEVLELFDTAVDTDIEGLRTTPTADPFEAMGISRNNAGEPSGGDGVAGHRRIPATRPVEDFTLDELLDAVKSEGATTPSEEAQKVKSDQPKREKLTYEEMSLDELLDELEGPRQPSPSKDGKQEHSQKDEEMSLDELLGDPAKIHKQQGPHQKKPEASRSPRNDAREMSLDELLGDPFDEDIATLPQVPAVNGELPAYEDLTLDELIRDLSSALEPSTRGGQKEESLDELLGFSTSDKAASVGAVRGSERAPDGTRPTKPRPHVKVKYEEEITLDEL